MIQRGFSIDPILRALERGEQASELLQSVFLCSLELDNGYHRCRHCRRTCHMGDALAHASDCIIGRIAGHLANVGDTSKGEARG